MEEDQGAIVEGREARRGDATHQTTKQTNKADRPVDTQRTSAPAGDDARPAPQNSDTKNTGATTVGADLRALRKSRGLTITALAEKLDRSIGFISQVERGLSEPSLTDLRKFAELFEVPIGFFFAHEPSEPGEQGMIVRANRRRQLGNPEDGLFEELLSPDLGGAFEVFRSVFQPGAALPEPIRRETEEAGYVVSGTLEMTIGGRPFTLNPGDSFRFQNEEYSWRNPGREPAVIIWVIAPPVY